MNSTKSADGKGGGQAEVFIVDDDDGMRRGMAFLLKAAGYRASAFASGQEFLDFFSPGMSGCLLLDVRMPGMSGLELQQRLGEMGSELPVIVVTAFANVPMAVRALKAGAFDFIEKPFEGADLVEKIRRALAVANRNRHDADNARNIRNRAELLTPRERQVMELVVAGKLNKQIASDLEISIKTVENHRACVMRKMAAESLADLVRMSLAAGIG
jgi:two-component system response regulator FixJ